MAITINHDDITELKRVFDDRYVKIEECNDKQEKINGRLANDDKRIDLILQEQKQTKEEMKSGFKFNNWLTAGVLAAIIGAVMAFYFMA